MNYLAHLHLAALANSSLAGNLLADFVRGDPSQLYPSLISDGIKLHRRIDSVSDTHPQVRMARSLFQNSTRRVAPIALDIVWDHFLARHWSLLESRYSLTEFTRYAQREIDSSLTQLTAPLPANFKTMLSYLWQEQWLERYVELPFIADVLQRMAVRRPKLVALVQSMEDIEQHYSQLETHFWHFYPALMEQVNELRS